MLQDSVPAGSYNDPFLSSVCKLIIDPFSPIISPLPSHDFPIISPCKPSVNDGESLEAARLGAMEPDVSPLRHLDIGAER